MRKRFILGALIFAIIALVDCDGSKSKDSELEEANPQQNCEEVEDDALGIETAIVNDIDTIATLTHSNREYYDAVNMHLKGHVKECVTSNFIGENAIPIPTRFNADGSEVLAKKYEVERDECGRVKHMLHESTQEYKIIRNGKVSLDTISSTSSISYQWENGLLVYKSEFLAKINSAGDLSMTQNMYYYEYASNGLLLKERQELSDGTVKIYEYNYQEFDEQENWIKREAEITDENGAEIMKQIQTREITYYE